MSVCECVHTCGLCVEAAERVCVCVLCVCVCGVCVCVSVCTSVVYVSRLLSVCVRVCV